MDPFIGQVILFAGNFAPRGWALCHGQLMTISQNTALFSILGTTYGGDGRTTFGLPDLRGRVAVSAGQGPGLQDVRLGQPFVSQTVTLSPANLPNTPILIPASVDDATTEEPNGKAPAVTDANSYGAPTSNAFIAH